MARQEAQSKLLYYPTPAEVVSGLVPYFGRNNVPTRLADPCAGEGAALAQFATALDSACNCSVPSELWMVELSYARASKAQATNPTANVLNASFYQMSPARWSNKSVSLIWNNPPYDWSDIIERNNGKERHVRHENNFVENATTKLAAGGHQIIIIPAPILTGDERITGAANKERMARHLAGWYESIKAWKFPADLYDIFKQIVIIASHRRAIYQPPTDDQINAIMAQAKNQWPTETYFQLLIPPTPSTEAVFKFTPTNPEQLANLARACSPINTPEYHRRTYVAPLGAPFRPATPLNLGHTTMMLTGRQCGLLKIKHPKHGEIIVKGSTIKIEEVESEEHANGEGKYSHTAVKSRERIQATLSIASAKGINMIDNAQDIGKFITENAQQIVEAILRRNTATYAYDPTPHEIEVVNQIALGLPPLPGRKESGLFEAQKHVSIAAARVMRRYKSAIINAEMGFGKTAACIGSLTLLNKWPVILVCPGHMIWKWARDIIRASAPDYPLTPRVITRPTLNTPPAWLAIRQELESAGYTITDTKRWQEVSTGKDDPTGCRRSVKLQAKPGIAGQYARLLNITKRLRNCKSNTANGDWVDLTFNETDDYTMLDFKTELENGNQRMVAIVSLEAAKYDAGDNEALATTTAHFRDPKTKQIYTAACCPGCGKPTDTKERRCYNTIDNGKKRCLTPLHNFNRWRRTGAARWAQHRIKFKVYVVDEAHKAQGGSTDVGAMDMRLVNATDYNLSLTGTLFGGCAGSLFHLLYRRSRAVRAEFREDEWHRWIDQYGTWERQWNQHERQVTGYGASSGIQRYGYRERELPGISPAVIKFLLPITMFANITDLGYDLPDFDETVESITMTPAQEAEYDWIMGEFLQAACKAAMDGDPGMLSVWFAQARYRPMSQWRDEIIDWTGKHTSICQPLPAVTDAPLPKEIRLAELIKANRAKKRKTLIYIEQSGTRDIRPHIADRLRQLVPGLLVESLSAGDMSPAQREAWIARTAPGLDALIVNPKLVETGLDLVMFQDIVFYETTTSLYVLWQSMRRVWRLGQSQPVTCTFLAYTGSMEEKILDRMGSKIKAASLLYGKEASGALVEAESDDIQREIIQAALAGELDKHKPDLTQGIFGASKAGTRTVAITIEAANSPTSIAPVIVNDPQPKPGETKQAAFGFLEIVAEGEVKQLTLFPGFEGGAPTSRRKRR